MPVNRAQRLAIQQRRQQVAELYLRCWTQEAIGAQLGIAQPTVCVDLRKIREHWRASSVRDFDEARTIELQKIDRVEREAWAAWERSQKPAQSAVVSEDTGRQRTRKSVKHQHGDPRFLDQINKCIAQRRALLGLDALPAQGEVNADAGVSLDVRRDRVITIVAALRERERLGGTGTLAAAAVAGDVRLVDEPG